jgi:hypothetical protein
MKNTLTYYNVELITAVFLVKATSSLYYKYFMIVIYDHEGMIQFAVYHMVVIYAPGYGLAS